ncbi:MAG: heparinase [Lachnospiraceae bacterium]|nr:heparinase [Lachnospiraceae bacterium]
MITLYEREGVVSLMQKQQIEYLQRFWKEIEQEAKVLSHTAMPVLTEKEFELFFQTGNRLVYEASYFGRRKYLTVYGILAVYRGEQEDIEKLTDILESVCRERYWALPAHVNASTRDELTIDLFAAETAQTLSELVYLLQDRLDDKVKTRILDEVIRRVMVPYMERRVAYGWETDPCNWSAVCAGSIGMAAVYLYRMGRLDKVQRDECIQRVCASMQCYIGGLEEDGACTEGLGYYSYGMSYFTGFAELAYEESQGNIDLMIGKKCENIALFQQKCYFGKGMSISFSDGNSKECFLPGMTAYMKHRFSTVETPDYSLARGLYGDHCYRWLTNERNIRWLMKYESDETESEYSHEEQYHLLPSAQWMIYKDKQGNGYAAKGGHNAESHNHNDVGHFLVVYQGEMFLTDLGAGEYTKEYFGAGRYDILCNRSLGHSVPIINDTEQCAGKEYCAGAFVWDEKQKELMISFASAYSEDAIAEVERKIQVLPEEKGKFSMRVRDCFQPSAKTHSVVENLITQYEPIVDNNSVVLQGRHGSCKITVDSQTEIAVLAQKHSNHEGVSEDVYLIQWKVPIDAGSRSESVIKIECW